jgi:hypothetical protein
MEQLVSRRTDFREICEFLLNSVKNIQVSLTLDQKTRISYENLRQCLPDFFLGWEKFHKIFIENCTIYEVFTKNTSEAYSP